MTLRKQSWGDSTYFREMISWNSEFNHVFIFPHESISMSTPVFLTKRIMLYNFQQITRSDMFQEEALVRDPTDSFTPGS